MSSSKKKLILLAITFVLVGVFSYRQFLSNLFNPPQMQLKPQAEKSSRSVENSDKTSLNDQKHESPQKPLPKFSPENVPWKATPEELEAALRRQLFLNHKSLSENGKFKLGDVSKTRNGYEAYPTYDDRKFFGTHLSFSRENNAIIAHTGNLSTLQSWPNDFPSYESSTYESLIRSYFDSRSECLLNNISKVTEYWYLDSEGTMTSALAYNVAGVCQNPRRRINELWLYSVESKLRIKIIKK